MACSGIVSGIQLASHTGRCIGFDVGIVPLGCIPDATQQPTCPKEPLHFSTSSLDKRVVNSSSAPSPAFAPGLAVQYMDHLLRWLRMSLETSHWLHRPVHLVLNRA